MKTKKITKNYLDIVFVPAPNLAWRESEKFVTLDVENKGFFNSIAQKFFGQPKVSHISLDKYGSALWLLLDGKNTVLDVVTKMKEKYSPEDAKMLNRVVTFFHTLQVNKYIVEKA
jgi:hypothetical protein